MTGRNYTVPAPSSSASDTDSPAWREFRDRAQRAYARLGAPHSKSEEFNYIRTGDIAPFLVPDASAFPGNRNLPSHEEVEKHILPESREAYLVLVDGRYIQSLSRPPQGLDVGDLSALADSEVGDFLRPFEETDEEDPLSALALSRCESPLRIGIPSGWKSASPLQILAYAASPASRTDAVIFISAGSLSESRFTFLTAGSEGKAQPARMDNFSVRCDLRSGASLHWQQAENAHDENLHMCKLQGRLERDSRFFALSASPGSRLTRRVFSFDLAGEGSDLELKCVTAAAGKRQSHNLAQINHLAPHCTSRQQFKNVVAEQSRSSVNGTIHVAQAAQQTNASQLINNLMLSDEAHADTKPRLMIFADDVKCSHGATVGRLDAEQLFYLQARGLTDQQARTYLTVAFIEEVLESAQSPSLRSRLESLLLEPLMRHLAAPGKES